MAISSIYRSMEFGRDTHMALKMHAECRKPGIRKDRPCVVCPRRAVKLNLASKELE